MISLAELHAHIILELFLPFVAVAALLKVTLKTKSSVVFVVNCRVPH